MLVSARAAINVTRTVNSIIPATPAVTVLQLAKLGRDTVGGGGSSARVVVITVHTNCFQGVYYRWSPP
jgi:hypothetical protein